MEDYQSLKHTKWDCKYHVIWIPKCRRKVLYGQLRRELGGVLRDLGRRRESEVIEGGLAVDHVHMLISIPPKYAVAQVVGYLKGKSAIWVARTQGGRQNFAGENFWARGYAVSTTGFDTETIREYIRSQEEEDKRLDQCVTAGLAIIQRVIVQPEGNMPLNELVSIFLANDVLNVVIYALCDFLIKV
jgi:putative transposase